MRARAASQLVMLKRTNCRISWFDPAEGLAGSTARILLGADREPDSNRLIIDTPCLRDDLICANYDSRRSRTIGPVAIVPMGKCDGLIEMAQRCSP